MDKTPKNENRPRQTTRIVQMSDLHFGASDENLARLLAAEIRKIAPDAVVISGDLTQRARRGEFDAARALMENLAVPQLIVPGNHDIPGLNLLERFTDPNKRFRGIVCGDEMPVLAVGNAYLVGIDTTRRAGWHPDWSRGGISARKARAAATLFHKAPPSACKIAVLHHPVMRSALAPRRSPAKGAETALAAFLEAGVHVVLAGHFHVSDLVTWPGEHIRPRLLHLHCGTAISNRLKGHPNAWYELHVGDETLAITRYEWSGSGFERIEMACLSYRAA